jgi:hypothetical protein
MSNPDIYSVRTFTFARARSWLASMTRSSTSTRSSTLASTQVPPSCTSLHCAGHILSNAPSSPDDAYYRNLKAFNVVCGLIPHFSQKLNSYVNQPEKVDDIVKNVSASSHALRVDVD